MGWSAFVHHESTLLTDIAAFQHGLFMKNTSIQRDKVGRFVGTKHWFGYSAWYAAVLVGLLTMINQAYAGSGALMFSGGENGEVLFSSADCTPIGEDLVTFSAPSDLANTSAEYALRFITSDYKIQLSSKKLGLCGRAKNSQGIFWHHVGRNWSLIFKDVQVSCTLLNADNPPVAKKVNLNGTLACTHIATSY